MEHHKPTAHLAPTAAYRSLAPLGWPLHRAGTDGSVWRFIRGRWRKRKLRLSATGYLIVALNERGRRQTVNVHTLVLTAFAGPRPAGMQCRHLDGDGANSALANLRWDTLSNNQHDRVAHGTSNRGERNGRAKLSAGDVTQIRALVAAGRSQREVARLYGVSQWTVFDIARRRRWGWLVASPAAEGGDR